MSLRKNFILILFLTSFIISSAALSSISTVPGYIDVEDTQGSMAPGEDFELSFFISVDSDEPVILEPSFEEPISSYIWGGKLTIQQSEYSEEDISDWVEMEDSIVVNPENQVEDGLVSANYELVVDVDIPEDAEPGYHAGQISLEPRLDKSEDGYGANAITSSIPQFVFRVEGDAERIIDFSDIEAVRTGENRVQLIQQFENTGTVTTTVDGGTASIVNSQGRRVGSVDIPSATIAPGEFEEVETTWNGAEEGGQYQLEGTADYMTGQAYVGGENSRFVVQGAIRDAINVEDVNDDLEEEPEGAGSTPLWLVVMVLVLLGVLMYSMDIDPFWIVLLLGLVGITSIILLTGIPNWTLPVLLVLSGGVLYFS